MDNKIFELRTRAVSHYLMHKSSLRHTSKMFGIHYQTLFRWVKKYKQQGPKWLFSVYKKPWNRVPNTQEKMVVKIKEKNPLITVRGAQRLLKKNGVDISLNGIWNIWFRYGYCGFNLKNISNDFTEFVTITKEAETKLFQAQKLYEKGLVKEAAVILNTIPCLPKNDLLLKIPDKLLNTRRKLEKLMMQFGMVPVSEYLKKARMLYLRCVKSHRYYSALRTGIALLVALSWQGNSEEFLKWTKIIDRLIPHSDRKLRNFFPIYFTSLMARSRMFMEQLKMKKAFSIAYQSYRQLLHHRKIMNNFLYDLTALFIDLEDFVKAEKLLNKSITGSNEQRRKKFKNLEFYIRLSNGDRKSARQLLNDTTIYDWARDAQIARYQALVFLIEGKPSQAIEVAQKSMNQSKGAGLLRDIANAHLTLASVYMSLGEKKQALVQLNELKKFLKKVKLRRQFLVTNIILGRYPKNKEILKLSTIRLAWLLKNRGYVAAYKYAQKRGIMLYFYNWILFFPEIVQQRINKGKSTGLPKAILRLPVFNKEIPVYHIKFLGNLVVSEKQQEYIKTKLRPKDVAILIYLCFKAMEPKRSIDLNEVYRNFWPNSEKASRNFSHLLVRVKKALKIPSHLLTVSRSYGETSLINEGIYFTTDYQEFEQTLARAKALQRAGEWSFAKKEYLQAFKLFRGEPFKKNFDDWSVDMRFRILSELETEAINFARACLEHNNKRDAKKVLEKVLKIIPDSEEIKELLDSLIV